ncbi:Subtilisin BL [Dermatophilus congolensis]|uniref:Subtilisin BL n=1 Tax=Dermatophilus congolensis TaxID=1863 RepID=A0AA46H0Z4_9MICO|nr:S8 family serine peptidase [Dermatophilus congolensis]STD12196.1 Subtilisin BL [Dermatophilus congolensis]
MKMIRRSLVIASAVALISPLAFAPTAGAASHTTQAPPAAHTTKTAGKIPAGHSFIINTEAGEKGTKTATEAIKKAGATYATSWPEIGVTVGIAPEAKVKSVVQQIRKVPGIQSVGAVGAVQKEKPRQPRKKVAPPKKAEKPGELTQFVGATSLPKGADGTGVTIGVADDGVFDEHNELAGRIDKTRSGSCTAAGVWQSGNDLWRPTEKKDTHGTMVSSIMTAVRDGAGMIGIAPKAQVVAMRVVSDNGDIYPEASICAAMQAVKYKLPIVNHSYGLDNVKATRHALWDPKDPDQGPAITAVNKAYDWSRKHGVLNIAATGNSGEDLSDKPHIPPSNAERNLPRLASRLEALLAEVPGVLGVGELDEDGTVAFSSTSGLGIVDLTARGSGVFATYPGEYQQNAGTSFASPAVSAVAALVKQKLPNATPDQIEKILEESAKPRTCAKSGKISTEQPCRARGKLTNYFGHGEVNAPAALKAADKLR